MIYLEALQQKYTDASIDIHALIDNVLSNTSSIITFANTVDRC
jgi:hypothetical protein